MKQDGLSESIEKLPTLPGVYALILSLNEPAKLPIGKLGLVELLPGTYVYFGSARGPGGVRARLGRHLRGEGKTHWHIDHLREIARVIEAFWCTPDDSQSWECRWVQAAAGFPGVMIPAAGFGSSDCRSGCSAHLLVVPDDRLPELQAVLQKETRSPVHHLSLT